MDEKKDGQMGLKQASLVLVGDQIEPGLNQAEIESIPLTENVDYFDVTRYIPEGVDVDLVEKGGALFIPHRINEFAVKVIPHKVALIVFQCVLRYSLGFNRPTCRLSNNFIAKWTGLHNPNVRKGLKEIKEMGLLRIVSPGSSSRATIYDVPIVRGFLDWKKNKEGGLKQAEIDSSSAQIKGGSKQSPEHVGVGLNQSPKGNQNNPTRGIGTLLKKENPKENLKKTLSQLESLPPKVKSYILSLKPRAKRVGEEHFLNQLLLDYKAEDIANALDYVQSKGTIDTHQPVHSPMNYLGHTIEQILGDMREQQERLERAEATKRAADEKVADEERKRKEGAELYRKAISQFESKLSEDEQNDFLNNYYHENYGDNGMIPKGLVKEFAIREWYKKDLELVQ